MIPTVRRHASRPRTAPAPLALAALTLISTLPAAGQQAAGRVELDRGLFSGWTYSYQTVEEEPVYGFGGLSFAPEFEALLGQHPPALERASRAAPWNTMRFMGGVGLVVGAGLILLDAIDDAESVSSGTAPDSGSGNLGLGVAVGSLVLAVVGEVVARGHLREGVALFNEVQGDEARGGSTGSAPRPRLRIRLAMGTPSTIGVQIPTPW